MVCRRVGKWIDEGRTRKALTSSSFHSYEDERGRQKDLRLLHLTMYETCMHHFDIPGLRLGLVECYIVILSQLAWSQWS